MSYTDYSSMTNDEFEATLREVIDEQNPCASQLLSIGGIYEILSEEYHNAVLDRWATENPERAGICDEEK